jgi:hypothetical protein
MAWGGAVNPDKFRESGLSSETLRNGQKLPVVKEVCRIDRGGEGAFVVAKPIVDYFGA